MGLGGCYSCIKYLMFAFNFLFWLLGCAILGVGIWVRVDPNFQEYVQSTAESFNHLYTAAYVLIAVGVIIMVIGFLGCCGAIRESQCMLSLFFIALVIIFAVLLGVGIWAIVSKDTLKQSVTDALVKAVNDYDTNDASKKLMDKVQENFHCCGASRGADDYMRTRVTAPRSCILENWAIACDKRLFAYFADNLIIIAGVAIGIGIVMLLGMIFSMMLCCAIREARV